jgi:hypothetical protein
MSRDARRHSLSIGKRIDDQDLSPTKRAMFGRDGEQRAFSQETTVSCSPRRIPPQRHPTVKVGWSGGGR